MTPHRILVLTVVHSPDDARIRHRQIASLLAAGWEVTYAAPFSGYGLSPTEGVPGLRALDVVRARGRRRGGAQRSARRVLRQEAADHDLVLLHDPELLLTLAGLRLPPVVWDVHEDTAAALEVRAWLPSFLRRPAAGMVRVLERLAERGVHLLLADRYYAARFRRAHPVVPNTTAVPAAPPPAAATPREGQTLEVVYLGSLTTERGAEELIEVGRRLVALEDGTLPPVRLLVMGPAHGVAARLLREAAAAGVLTWTGPVPNDRALARLEGALAGLSLLRDVANFRPSMPTKVVEYLARGVPVITTPLPVPARLVERSGAGVVVPFGTVEEVASAVVDHLVRWARDPAVPARLGAQGYAVARAELDWARQGREFVSILDRIASAG